MTWTFGEQLALEGMLEPRQEPARELLHGNPTPSLRETLDESTTNSPPQTPSAFSSGDYPATDNPETTATEDQC